MKKTIDTKGKLTSRGQTTDEGLILEILINELSSVFVIHLTEVEKLLSPNATIYLCNIVDASSKFGWSRIMYDKTSESVL